MRTKPFQIGRTACLLIGGLLVGCWVVACQPGGGGDSGAAYMQEKRFTFVRGKNQLIRIDSATGRVWVAPESGDGGWIELKPAPSPDGKPETPGRYGLFSIVDRLNIAPNQLLRVDRSTGRSWLRETPSGRTWNAIGDAGNSSEEEAPVPPAPQIPSRPAAARPSPAAPRAEPLPVVSRAVLNASSGNDEQKLKVVVEALKKPGLAVEIRVWAAKQLAVFDPEVAVPPLKAALNDDQPEIIVAAIGSLSQLGDPTTIPSIQALQNHPNPAVQSAAKAALTGQR